MESRKSTAAKTCGSGCQDFASMPSMVANMFSEMMGMITNPTKMFGEMTSIMTNPSNMFTLGQRLLPGWPEGRPSSGQTGTIEYQLIALGPVEHVLAFTTDELIFLKGLPDNPHFSSHGLLVDFQHNPLPGMFSRLSFPIKGVDVDDANLWPPVQPEPFDEPDLHEVHANKNGFSKQAYFFDGGASSLVTVGPSLPKIIKLKGGGAQFWVASNGVITQGTGKYKGARGISAYNGSSNFETWPETQEQQFEMLSKGFKALVSAYFKLVLEPNIVEQSHQTSSPEPDFAQALTNRRYS
jgi:hypothetical protein